MTEVSILQRQCNVCKLFFPATSEFLISDPRYALGFRPRCKKCHNAKSSAWRRKQWAENPEESRAKKREKYKREKAAGTIQKIRSRPDQIAKSREYNRTHKTTTEQNRIKTMKRRAKKRNLPVDFTMKYWLAALDYFDGRCAACGRPPGLWHRMSQDHWISISKGGGTTRDNIIPLCHGLDGCNNTKSAKQPEAWLISRFGKRKAKEILERVNTYFEWVKLQQ